MESCLFCKIASTRIPSNKVFEDDEIYAFHDIGPQAPVHVLIVPKRHLASLSAATDDDTPLLGRMMHRAAAIAEELGIAKSGYRTVINTGVDGGQTVAHLHVHLLGGRALAWPPG